MYATRDVEIDKGTRVAQFRLMPNMKTMFWGKQVPDKQYLQSKIHPLVYESGFINLTDYDLVIVYVDDLGSSNRGGLGSTGY